MTNDEGMTNDEQPMARRFAAAISSFVIRHSFVIGISSLVLVASAAHAMATPAEQLHALFAEDWQWRLRDQPEWATVLGDHRYDDRLTDLSPEAITGRREHGRDMLSRLSAIDRGQLTRQDVFSPDVFHFEQQLAVAAARFPLDAMMLDQLDGPQLALGRLVDFMRFRHTDDFGKYIARLRAYPRYLEQVTALLKRGIAERWVQPRGPIASIPAQIDGQVVNAPTASPLFEPFRRVSGDVSEGEPVALAQAGEAAIPESVFPAIAAFRHLL